MYTQAFGIPYNDEKLSAEEIQELENYCMELKDMLFKKIENMGLHVTFGLGMCITKFTKEELEFMDREYEKAIKIWKECLEDKT